MLIASWWGSVWGLGWWMLNSSVNSMQEVILGQRFGNTHRLSHHSEDICHFNAIWYQPSNWNIQKEDSGNPQGYWRCRRHYRRCPGIRNNTSGTRRWPAMCASETERSRHDIERGQVPVRHDRIGIYFAHVLSQDGVTTPMQYAWRLSWKWLHVILQEFQRFGSALAKGCFSNISSRHLGELMWYWSSEQRGRGGTYFYIDAARYCEAWPFSAL